FFKKLSRLFVEFYGIVESAEHPEGAGQSSASKKRIGVIPAECLFPQLQRIFEEGEGFGKSVTLIVAVGQVVHAPERIGVAGATVQGVDCAGFLELVDRKILFPQVME